MTTRTLKLEPGDTISGIFNKIKKGEKVRLDALSVKETTIRQEAVRRNNEARKLRIIQPWEVVYSVSNREKEGFITIICR